MTFTYDDYGDTVLYDVFYEACTYYGGVLAALEDEAKARGAHERAREIFERHLALNRERASINPDDREALIASIENRHNLANECKERSIKQSA